MCYCWWCFKANEVAVSVDCFQTAHRRYYRSCSVPEKSSSAGLLFVLPKSPPEFDVCVLPKRPPPLVLVCVLPKSPPGLFAVLFPNRLTQDNNYVLVLNFFQITKIVYHYPTMCLPPVLIDCWCCQRAHRLCCCVIPKSVLVEVLLPNKPRTTRTRIIIAKSLLNSRYSYFQDLLRCYWWCYRRNLLCYQMRRWCCQRVHRCLRSNSSYCYQRVPYSMYLCCCQTVQHRQYCSFECFCQRARHQCWCCFQRCTCCYCQRGLPSWCCSIRQTCPPRRCFPLSYWQCSLRFVIRLMIYPCTCSCPSSIVIGC